MFDQITQWLRNPFIDEVEEQRPDGTIEIYVNIKGNGLRRWIGELLSCFWCTGIWSAVVLVGGYWFFPSFFIPIIIVLSVAGAASFIEVVVQRLS